MSPYEQDLVDLLDIMAAINKGDQVMAANMIFSMRVAVAQRGKPEGGIYVPLSYVEVRPEDGQRKDED